MASKPEALTKAPFAMAGSIVSVSPFSVTQWCCTLKVVPLEPVISTLTAPFRSPVATPRVVGLEPIWPKPPTLVRIAPPTGEQKGVFANAGEVSDAGSRLTVTKLTNELVVRRIELLLICASDLFRTSPESEARVGYLRVRERRSIVQWLVLC